MNKYLIDKNGFFKAKYERGPIPPFQSLIETDLKPVYGDLWGGIGWVKAGQVSQEMINPRPAESLYVETTRFLRELLTLPIYGAMEVAEVGLSAKFSAGVATNVDIELLGLFRAAKVWIAASQSINLMDAAVEAVLDACIAIPQIGLTTDDKARILRNEAKAWRVDQ